MQASHPQQAGPAGAFGPGVAYRIVRAMFVVLFFWVFWKFGGYIITALVVRHFGSGATSDAYFFATQAVVYGLIFAPAMSVLVPAFIPVFTEQRAQGGEAAAWAFARSVLLVVLLGCGVMLALAYLLATPITDMLVRGFDAEARGLGVRMVRWLLPGAALMVVFLLLRSLLHSYKVFGYPAAAEAAQKLLWVAVFAAGVGLWGVQAALAGFVVGSAVMVGLAAFGLRGRLARLWRGAGALGSARLGRELLWALGFLAGTGAALWGVGILLPEGLSRYRDLVLITLVLGGVLLYALLLWRRSRGRSGAMARFAALAVPLGIGSFFACYRNVVTVYFQSFTQRGMFTDIEAARKLVNFPIDLVALALSVAMLPYLCELASRRDRALLGDVLTKALRMLAVGFVPLTVMTLVLADPVCRLAFDRGDRAAEHLRYTALALQLLSVALVVYAAERVIMQGYFSLQRMWPPALLGIAAAFVQVGFMGVPIYALGMDAPVQVFVLVALSYPVGRAFKNLALLLLLRGYVPVLPARESMVFFAKLALLSAAVAAASWGGLHHVRRWLPYEQLRERKVVVANFDVDPRVLSAPAASGLQVGPVPGRPGVLAAAMTYRRGPASAALTLHLDRLVGRGRGRLSFTAAFERPTREFQVEAVDRRGQSSFVRFRRPADDTAVVWTGTLGIGEDGLAAVRWREMGAPATGETNTLYLLSVRREGFDAGSGSGRLSYWEGVEGIRTQQVDLAGEGRRPGRALLLPAGQEEMGLPCSPAFPLDGTERLRCRVLNDSDDAVRAELLVRAPAPTVHPLTLEPRRWHTVDLAAAEPGLGAGGPAALEYVGLRVEGAHGPVYLDDVALRTPPRTLDYALVMFLHCAVPTAAGLAIMLVLLRILRFAELGYVVRWVRERGWRRRAAEGGTGDEAP